MYDNPFMKTIWTYEYTNGNCIGQKTSKKHVSSMLKVLYLDRKLPIRLSIENVDHRVCPSWASSKHEIVFYETDKSRTHPKITQLKNEYGRRLSLTEKPRSLMEKILSQICKKKKNIVNWKNETTKGYSSSSSEHKVM